MTPRRERQLFAGAAIALWLLFVIQAALSPVLLDDWFQLRYWRDHDLGAGSLWMYAQHNYFHYNPRIGEVFLALVDGSRPLHLILTPLIQLSLLPAVFVIAFGRRPRGTLVDLQLLLVIQVMIWLVIPIPGILYFYRPFTTNYLWAFAITLALFVPYRLALATDTPPRYWLAPLMLVLGWTAGMCNEHTGPTAMIAMAGLLYAAWRLRRLRAWMFAGMLGLYIGYPMLLFAPGQAVRYGGIAAHYTPVEVLSERGFVGCVEILVLFVRESQLGILLFVAALASYVVTRRQRGLRTRAVMSAPAIHAGLLVAAAFAIVVTLFVSPTATDRVLFASGVLVVAAFAIGVQQLFVERVVRRFVVGACLALALYHAVRFIDTAVELHADTGERIALLEAAAPGSLAVVPSYRQTVRSRWQLGDDFALFPWLADYVGGELYDLSAVQLDHPRPVIRPVVVSEPALAHVPTYREWQAHPLGRDVTIRVLGLLFIDPQRRPIFVVDRGAFVDGHPYDDTRGHFIRIAQLPARTRSISLVGCKETHRVEPVADGDGALLPVDERDCRGPFTAVACALDRCWVAGWY